MKDLTKYVKDLNTENYRTLLREIKLLNKSRDNSCSWVRRLNIVEMSLSPNWPKDSVSQWKIKNSQWFCHRNHKETPRGLFCRNW